MPWKRYILFYLIVRHAKIDNDVKFIFFADCILPNDPNFEGYGRIRVENIDAPYTRNKMQMVILFYF